MKKDNKNEIFRISRPIKISLLAVCFAGGALYAAALPPFNWSFAVFFTLLPLMFAAMFYRWHYRLLCGWVWGLGWSIFAYRFLREIHPAIPWMLAPVISLWPAAYTFLLGFFSGTLFDRNKLNKPLNNDLPFSACILFLFSAAALFTILEWTRCRLFVWNDFSVTLWRYPELMQISALTGRYGTSFMITSVNAAVFALIFMRRRLFLASAMMIFPVFSYIYGICRISCEDGSGNKVIWKCALIQGNMPQQRRAGIDGVLNAIKTYAVLSAKVAEEKPHTIFWPECAVPIPFRSASSLGQYYRDAAASIGSQMLIGTLDFNENKDMTNGAILLGASGKIEGKYDKFHRVPFGEYVPFRKYLSESMIRKFDMGRDLAAGAEIMPLRINDDIKCGTAICYEGVFSYLSAEFARQGANVLAALSNDVWYPESSEPEQHLANAVMRCVETGLPMVRCGNNGGSGVVTARGEFTQYIGTAAERPELLREKASGIVLVEVEKTPKLTFAVRYENFIVYLLIIFVSGVLLFYPLLSNGDKKGIPKGSVPDKGR